MAAKVMRYLFVLIPWGLCMYSIYKLTVDSPTVAALIFLLATIASAILIMEKR